MTESTLSNLSNEERRFEPATDFTAGANVNAESYEEGNGDRLAFWANPALLSSLLI